MLDWIDFNAPTGKVMGVSFDGGFIPESSGVLTTISFSDVGDAICFAEQECSTGACINAIASGDYEMVEKYKEIRSYDLSLIDRSDFIIAHLLPEVASWGSAEEIVTAVRMKKPLFISMEGGKHKTPLWMMGMLPHNYIYDSIEEVVDMVKQIDNG